MSVPSRLPSLAQHRVLRVPPGIALPEPRAFYGGITFRHVGPLDGPQFVHPCVDMRPAAGEVVVGTLVPGSVWGPACGTPFTRPGMELLGHVGTPVSSSLDERPDCFPQMLRCHASPPDAHEGFRFSASSWARQCLLLLQFCAGYTVASHCGADGISVTATGPSVHSYAADHWEGFAQGPLQTLGPFLNWAVCCCYCWPVGVLYIFRILTPCGACM